MAHKTLIGGTAYEISGGKTLVGGTAYSIKNGKTLVGGTVYEVGFGFPPLNECTPEQIQAAAQSGQAPNYWAVGDMTAGISLNGTVGALTFNNETYYAFIIGFNHNSGVEGGNSIHFQFGKTADGVDIAFVDDASSIGSTAGFRINTSNSNVGGWSSSYMRNTICPAFLVAIPTPWQDVIKPCTKYTDNTGNNVNTADCVTATSDKIWLLAEWEVLGTQSAANSAEQNYQKQYDYYKNGGEQKKYKHNAPTLTASGWWYRSPYPLNTASWCRLAPGNPFKYSRSDTSYGFAPGFMVA